MKGIKAKQKGKDESNKIEGIKRTREGKVLIMTQKDKKATEAIEKLLKDKK